MEDELDLDALAMLVMARIGMAQAEAHADEEWKEACTIVIERLARTCQRFTTEDVRAELAGIPVSTHTLKAIGPLMKRAQRARLIEKDGIKMSGVSGNGRYICTWASLVYRR